MKLVPLVSSLVLFACGSPTPAVSSAEPPTTTPTATPIPADAGTVDEPPPAPVDAGAPLPASGCPRPEAPASLVADVAVASLPKVDAVDGSIGPISSTPVFRGSIYQHVTLAVGQHQALRVPEGALVAEGSKANTIEVYVAKRLGFAGHPPEAMGVDSVRHNMGLATTDDGTTFVLATYGEFDTRIEGSASVQLFVRVPKGFPVRTADGLAGDRSEPSRWPDDAASMRASESGRVGYWYAPVNPRKGWSRVKLVDDTRRVASHAGTYPPLAPPCPR